MLEFEHFTMDTRFCIKRILQSFEEIYSDFPDLSNPDHKIQLYAVSEILSKLAIIREYCISLSIQNDFKREKIQKIIDSIESIKKTDFFMESHSLDAIIHLALTIGSINSFFESYI